MKIIKKNTKLKKNICKINNDYVDKLYGNIYGKEKGVPELTLKDFIYNKSDKKVYINNPYFSDKKGFIIFYAPWCKHCVKISQLIIDLALDNINYFPIGAVNIENTESKNDYLAQYSKINDIPAIKYISDDNSLKDYSFEYDIDNLIFFINTNG